MTTFVLGCGFTGLRVARRLAARGERVVGTFRDAAESRAVAEAGATPAPLDADDPASVAALSRALAAEEPARLLVAIPPAPVPGGGERTARLVAALPPSVARVVHLSSTVVYGGEARVDERTPAAPATARGRLYLDAEAAVRGGPWSSLVLRSAAIYGPGRGLLAEGGPRFSHARSLDAVVSRIHVDDLAALAVAALDGGLTGAWPVADDEPASGRALLAAWAGERWAPPPGRADPPGSRRVDGTAVRAALGVALRYPSFRGALP